MNGGCRPPSWNGDVRVLDRKVWREVANQKGQVLAVALVVGCGIATFVTMRSAYTALIASQASYYQIYRFADVFAHVNRAPNTLTSRLLAVPGVADVESRISFECNLDVANLDEPATGRFLSLPRRLNLVCLRNGRLPAARSVREVLVSEAFAQANHLLPGDTLRAVLNGRWTALTITGVAISPEYIYELPNHGVFPDNQRFGVIWMDPEALATIFNMRGAFNSLSLALAPGASEPEAIAQLDHLLERYGSQGAYGRKDQLSHRFITDEIAQDRITGIFVPAIFLAIAAFLTHVVLSRMIAMQRDQIAVLKVFGYANPRIFLHYVEFALLPVMTGTAGGMMLGVWLGRGLARLYANYFHFPELSFELSAATVAGSLAAAAISSVVGAAVPVAAAMRLAPAEAMQPPRPARFRVGVVEMLGLTPYLSLTIRMVIRNIERRPLRTAISILGMGTAAAVLLVSHFFTDAISYLMHFQFEIVSRETATVMFRESLPWNSRYEVARLPAVQRVEPFRAAPTRLRFGHRSYLIGVQGIPSDAELHLLVDRCGRPFSLPDDGLVMTTKLAEILHLRTGDQVQVEFLEGQRLVRQIRLAATVDELMSVAVYMNFHALARHLRESPRISGVYLSAEAGQASELFSALKRRPAVANVMVRDAMLASFQRTIAESLGISTRIIMLFSIVIAFSIVYNAVRVALSERAHELASLRVLGFTRGEVARLLLGEQLLILTIATPVGLAIGYGLCAWLAHLMDTELFRVPVVIYPASYAATCGMLALSAALSAAIVLRGIWRLDLVSALKTRE